MMFHSLTRHSIVHFGFADFHRYQPRHHLANRRLQVDLTCWRVYNTCQGKRPFLSLMAASLLPHHCFLPSRVVPFTPATTSGAWPSCVDEWVAGSQPPLPLFSPPCLSSVLLFREFFCCLFFFPLYFFSLCFAALFVFCCLFVLWVAVAQLLGALILSLKLL
jgi:hypothetical protein